MAIIGKIRERSGLLLIVMAVTLLLFILSDALPKMGSGEEGTKATVFDEEIDMQAYYNLVEQKINETNIQRQQQGQPLLDEISSDQVREQVWEEFVADKIYEHELRNFGFEITPEELNALFFTEGAHDYVKNIPIFRDSVTQQFRPDLVKKFRANQVEKDQYLRQQWTKVEAEVKKQALKDKYNVMVKNGLYVNKFEAQRDYENNNKKYKIKLVAARIDNISDSAVKVTENDIKAAYENNKHRRQYENTYGSTRFEYIEFPIIPSKADVDYIKNDLEELKGNFKTTDNDSLFVTMHSTNKNTMPTFAQPISLPFEVDSLIQLADSGDVVGPFLDETAMKQGASQTFKLIKVVGFTGTQKEARVRHILLSKSEGEVDALKAKADSLKKVIQANNNFTEMVLAYSGDPGSVNTGGVYNWFPEGQMVPEFNDASFNGKAGDFAIVETSYGVHLIQVLGQREGKKAMILTVDAVVEPGEETINEAKEKAMEFFDKIETGEDFTKLAQKQNMSILEKEILAKNKFIDQNTNSRELARRIHEASNDELIEPIIWGDKVIIAHIKNIRKEGIPQLEDIRVMMEAEARREKKLELVAKQLKGAKSLTDAAQRSNSNIMDMEVKFADNALPGVGGAEAIVVGTIFSFGKNDIGKVSKPIKGKNGMYMFQLEQIIEAPKTNDYTANKQTVSAELKRRAIGTYNDGDIYKALKKKANVVDIRQMY